MERGAGAVVPGVCRLAVLREFYAAIAATGFAAPARSPAAGVYGGCGALSRGELDRVPDGGDRRTRLSPRKTSGHLRSGTQRPRHPRRYRTARPDAASAGADRARRPAHDETKSAELCAAVCARRL